MTRNLIPSVPTTWSVSRSRYSVRGWHSSSSSVLNSERAIQVNIGIMRVFVRLREMMATHKDLAFKLIELEERLQGHDEQIQNIFEAIRQLMTSMEPARKKIGFVNEPAAKYGKAKKRSMLKQVCDGNL